MKTELILSIIAGIVILTIIAYFAHNKDGFIPTPTPNIPFMTPMQIAKQKGYDQIVSFLTNQANTTTDASNNTALEIVYIINYAASEEAALNFIESMYWPRVGASSNISVPVMNYHPFGGYSNSSAPKAMSQLSKEEVITLLNFLYPTTYKDQIQSYANDKITLDTLMREIPHPI